ncbi:tail fiber domain-containing protein [Myxococcota bacterium]|nr:tail fiber domain-containing protein [Myxococcota bacterium]
MRSVVPIACSAFGLALAVLMTLPSRALANWGEDWGTMLWSSTATPVPGLEGLGLGLLLGALSASAAWVLGRRRPAMGLFTLLVALVIPIAVAAGTITIPHTFTNGTPANADEVNANFVAVKTGVDDNAADIATQAATLASQGPHTVPGTGSQNTAVGVDALASNTSGDTNTATGVKALEQNSSGYFNTASGYYALGLNTIGHENTAVGWSALGRNISGNSNTASGLGALSFNANGNHNTAMGHYALLQNTSGSRNIGLGAGAGMNLTTGDHNIMIGNLGVAGEAATTRIGAPAVQARAFIAGIRGATTGVADAVAVVIDSAGQLGTVSSSQRAKEDVAPMADKSAALAALRPVTFRYKQAFAGGEKPIQFGLIAEEVAAVLPELVVFDREGRPETVKYRLLSSLLLNEFQKLSREHAVLKRQYSDLRSEGNGEVARLEERLSALEEIPARLASLEARVEFERSVVRASATSPTVREVLTP